MPISSRTAALLGWIGVAMFAIGSIVAALAYDGTAGEPYSPLNHYVSELGARQTGGLGVLFNAGLVIARVVPAGLPGRSRAADRRRPWHRDLRPRA